MNAIRQFITIPDGKVTLQLPKEYYKKRLEIIILPAEETLDELGEAMDKMSATAEKNGLTETLLAELLNE